METILINDKEISLKKDTNNLTIKEFKQFFMTDKNTEIDETEKHLIQMSILTDISVDELENLDLDEYKALGKKAYEVFNTELNSELITSFESNGKTYGTKLKDNGEAKITLKDINLIKTKLLTIDSEDKELQFINNLDVLAGILFKEVIDGKLIDTVEDADIALRASVFNEEMSLQVIYPYIMRIIEKMK